MTEFQQKVYSFVRTIPKGQTATYKEVAIAIGHPKAYRAVGNALNKNPQIGIIPCHRVIGSNGQTGGFAHGTRKRVKLLQEERIIYITIYQFPVFNDLSVSSFQLEIEH